VYLVLSNFIELILLIVNGEYIMKNYNIFNRYKGTVKLKMTIFLSWSILMVFVGSLAGNNLSGNIVDSLSFSEVYAATAPSASNGVIRLDRDRLSGNNLGEYAPYEPEFGDLISRGHEYYYSKDDSFGVGVWVSKPGDLTITNIEYDELMYVIDGSIVMTDDKGNSETYGAGEGLILPKGWTGTLTVPEGGVRKIWASYMAGKKG
jgi:uncharacterized cupin superfamily protein